MKIIEMTAESNKLKSRLLCSDARSTVTSCLPKQEELKYDQISQPSINIIPTLNTNIIVHNCPQKSSDFFVIHFNNLYYKENTYMYVLTNGA